MVRNAKDDLALCDKATPGPWKYDGMHNEIQTPRGETYWLIVSECRSAPDQGYPDDPQYDANFDFIAMAREALPHWIERAVAAEKEIAELMADLQERDQALHVESEALGYADDRSERMEWALERACKFVEDVTGNCPLVLDRDFDFDYCEEHCINDFAGCWKKYFLEGDK
jgi:hypothetical protein